MARGHVCGPTLSAARGRRLRSARRQAHLSHHGRYRSLAPTGSPRSRQRTPTTITAAAAAATAVATAVATPTVAAAAAAATVASPSTHPQPGERLRR